MDEFQVKVVEDGVYVYRRVGGGWEFMFAIETDEVPQLARKLLESMRVDVENDEYLSELLA